MKPPPSFREEFSKPHPAESISLQFATLAPSWLLAQSAANFQPAFTRSELSEDALVGTTARLGFVNVIDALHVIGSGPIAVRFFVDERRGTSRGVGAIRLTDDLRRLAGSMPWCVSAEARTLPIS